jgi:hypothetical protein
MKDDPARDVVAVGDEQGDQQRRIPMIQVGCQTTSPPSLEAGKEPGKTLITANR